MCLRQDISQILKNQKIIVIMIGKTAHAVKHTSTREKTKLKSAASQF